MNEGFFWTPEAEIGSLLKRHVKHQIRRFATSTKVNRNSRFDSLKTNDMEHFKSIVGAKGVIVDKDELVAANTDWMHKYQGHSQILLRPQTTQQV